MTFLSTSKTFNLQYLRIQHERMTVNLVASTLFKPKLSKKTEQMVQKVLIAKPLQPLLLCNAPQVYYPTGWHKI